MLLGQVTDCAVRFDMSQRSGKYLTVCFRGFRSLYPGKIQRYNFQAFYRRTPLIMYFKTGEKLANRVSGGLLPEVMDHSWRAIESIKNVYFPFN